MISPGLFFLLLSGQVLENLCVYQMGTESHFLTVNMSFKKKEREKERRELERKRERMVSFTNIHAIGEFKDPYCCRIQFLAKCTLSALEVNHGISGDARQHKYEPLETVTNLIMMRVVLTQPLQFQHLNKPWQLDKQMLQDRSFSLKQSKHRIFYDYQ